MNREQVMDHVKRSSWFLLLIVLCALLFFVGLGDRDLTSSHEARAAQNAQMILDEGCWLLPRLFDAHVELQKPPLYYWLVAVLAWLRGGVVDGWAVRLPAALAALATVLWLSFLCRRRGNPLAGFLAGLILATFVHFTYQGRVGRIDMPLTFAAALSLGSFFLGLMEERKRWLVLAYVGLGLGLLLKGPIVAVLAAAVLLPWWVLMHRQAAMLWRSLSWGLPLVLAMALPWYVAANWHSDNQVWQVFLWEHNIERGFGSDRLASHPFWFYLVRAPIDLLPWSVLLPVALWQGLSEPRPSGSGLERALHDGRGSDDARFALLWFGGILIMLSLMRFKRADYLAPAYPGAAWFLGLWLARRWQLARATTARWSAALLAAGLISYVTAWQLIEKWQAGDQSVHRLAETIRRHTDGMVIFFRTEDHALAFHVGRPLDTILEWENLDWWASQSMPIYFVMPPDCAHTWSQHLQHGRLEVVERCHTRLRRPLVLLRNMAQNP